MPTDDKVLDLSDYDFATFDAPCFRANGVQRVIIGSYSNPPGHARQMANACRAAGIEVIGLYGFVYYGDSVFYANRDIDAAIALAQEFGVARVWIDAEQDAAGIGVSVPPSNPAQRVAQTQAAVANIRAAGLLPGIYTGAWWWVPQTLDSHAFSALPLWHSEYGAGGGPRAPVLTVAYGGWSKVAIHQYTSTVVLCGRERDHNYLLDESMAGQGGDDMTEDEKKLLVALGEALAGSATGATGNVVAELTAKVKPMADAPVYTAIQNQQAALTAHEAAHGGAAGTSPTHRHAGLSDEGNEVLP